uniref:NEDD8-activating enzyme E1 regulatory subunit n=1 Tax=Caenorhabditis japonica TaxID=281687 RepID=A0A8R1DVX3_CAEJA
MPPSIDSGIRYDRQVRLWGEEGQASIGSASVCVLGCDSLGTEILKSLVLAGVHAFCIIDGTTVEPSDIGQNFFLHVDDIGKPRAEVVLDKLLELNPSVHGSISCQPPNLLTNEDLTTISKFTVVVSANQTEEVDMTFSKALYNIGIPLVCVKTYGLLGSVKICINEHTILNTHEDNSNPDLRLDVPFEKLSQLVKEVDLNEISVDELRHTPYLLLYFKALEVYRKERNDLVAFPENYKDRQRIQQILKDFRRSSEESGSKDSENFDEARAAVNRAFQRTTIGNSLKSILTDNLCSTSTKPFWIICEALRQFAEANNGLLPLRGTLPDMASDTNRYTRLTTIFHEKALVDAKEVVQLAKAIEKKRGVDGIISDEIVYRFCKNADKILVQRGSCLDYASELPNVVKTIREQFEDGSTSGSVGSATWVLLLRAVERFRKEKGRFPGTNGVPVSIDARDLKVRIESLVRETETVQQDTDAFDQVLQKVSDSAIAEMCRFGAAELHVISSYIGGIAAQEVIKLSTNQYVPIDNTFVFDGHTQQSASFKF